METKLILAGDLSLSCPAFALIEVNLTTKEVSVKHLSHIKTNSRKSLGYRLFQIYNHLNDIIITNEIDEFVVEKGFNKFATATAQLQRVVGVVTICVYYHYKENDIIEIAPTSVKKAITGNGKASKEELSEALAKYVGEIEYKNTDESDALGVALSLALQKGWL